MPGIDRVVLLSLIPSNRWASVQELAVQLGTVPSVIEMAVADAIADGEPVTVHRQGASYRRYSTAPRHELLPPSLPPTLTFDQPIASFAAVDLVTEQRPNPHRRAVDHRGPACHRCGNARRVGMACQVCARRTYLKPVEA